MQIKTGTRLKSTVCDAEIMVVTAPEGDIALTCGGAPMSDTAVSSKGTIDAGHSGGLQIGKRYVHEEKKLEVLCIKPGAGSLALDGEPLALKSAKKLPKTD